MNENQKLIKNRNILYGLLVIIILLLLVLIFKGNIKSYFRTNEVLSKVNTFNLWDVAFDCYDYVNDESGNVQMSDKCRNTYQSFQPKVEKWNKLIKSRRFTDINCKDFKDKKDAQDFYQYVNGEIAQGIYAYKTLHPENDGYQIVGTTNIWDGKCRYDPYGLDTNGDCDACENFSNEQN